MCMVLLHASHLDKGCMLQAQLKLTMHNYHRHLLTAEGDSEDAWHALLYSLLHGVASLFVSWAALSACGSPACRT